MTRPKGPVLIDAEALDDAPNVADAPPVPDAGPPEGQAMVRMAHLAARKPSRLGRMVLGALFGLAGLALSVWLWDFVTGLLARNVWIGGLSLTLAAIVALGLLIWLFSELAGWARLSRIEGVQTAARDARASSDRVAAVKVTDSLDRLYRSRPELTLARETVTTRRDEVLDADALLDLGERELMTPLDTAARAEIEAASRIVAGATALIPIALADLLTTLVANLRMIRRIAEIYGGRAGTLGSWRLLRAVATHLIATGAVAVGDDLLGSVAGGGAVSKVSRRFGEGVVNGALTARVGIAAMEVCRPMPFSALPRPRVGTLIGRALKGLFDKGEG